VPIYIHPGPPHPAMVEAYYADYLKEFPSLNSAAWGFTIDTANQVVRMILSGLFDAYPNLKIIVGHMGESIPFLVDRIDEALSRPGNTPGVAFKDTFLKHFYITTSGHFSTPALLCAMLEMGIDRILFSVDWPFVENEPGMRWMETVPLSAADKELHVRHGAVDQVRRLEEDVHALPGIESRDDTDEGHGLAQAQLAADAVVGALAGMERIQVYAVVELHHATGDAPAPPTEHLPDRVAHDHEARGEAADETDLEGPDGAGLHHDLADVPDVWAAGPERREEAVQVVDGIGVDQADAFASDESGDGERARQISGRVAPQTREAAPRGELLHGRDEVHPAAGFPECLDEGSVVRHRDVRLYLGAVEDFDCPQQGDVRAPDLGRGLEVEDRDQPIPLSAKGGSRHAALPCTRR